MKKISKNSVIAVVVVLLVLTTLLCSCSMLGGGTAESYTISFYVDGEVFRTVKIDSTTTSIQIPTPPTKDGYKFEGWYLDNNVWKNKLGSDSLANVSSNKSIYARYIAITQISVTYSIDGVRDGAAETFEEGEPIVIRDLPTKEGYTFSGWKLNNGEAVPQVAGTESLSVVGSFTANVYKIFVTFDDAVSVTDGVLSDSAGRYYVEAVYDEAFNEKLSAIVMSKADAEFAYWNYNGDVLDITADYTYANDIEIAAEWGKHGSDGFTFVKNSSADTYRIASYDGTDTDVIVPMTYMNMPITRCNAGVFAGNTAIEKIEFQHFVSNIESGALSNCTSLKEVVLPANLTNIGTNVFSGCSCTIFSLATKKPPQFAANWCGDCTVVFDGKQYDGKTFYKDEPTAIAVAAEFTPSKVELCDNGAVTDVTSQVTIGTNQVTFDAAYLSALRYGDFTFRFVHNVCHTVEISISKNADGQYDKADYLDFEAQISASVTPVAVYGCGIQFGQYDCSLGKATLHKEFLETLPAGINTFVIVGVGYSEEFSLNVKNTQASPKNVKLDYDINEPNATILFDCDYLYGTYQYRLDNGAWKNCESGDTVSGILKDSAHTLEIKCVESNKISSIYTAAARTDASEYTSKFFTLNGDKYDYYMADTEEFCKFVKYLVYSGCNVANLTRTSEYPFGYVSGTVYSEIAVDNELLDAIKNSFTPPYGYEINTSTLNSICTVKIVYATDVTPSKTSGYLTHNLSDNHLSLEEAGTRSASYGSFAINGYTKTEKIHSTAELDDLPYGVKPIFEGSSSAYSIYNVALNICRTYISDSMTDIEKAKVFYTWLGLNVTYDYNAIKVVALQSEIEAASVTIAAAKNKINALITDTPSLSSLLTPLLSETEIDELRAATNNVVRSLKCFYLDGVFTDGIAVCDGIASAFKLLCNIEGIRCEEISGYAGEAHAWNKVFIDDEWYVVDATWARSSDTALSYQWFMVNDITAMSGTHPHKEQAQSDSEVAVIENIAYGDYNYYDSYVIDAAKGYDLIADSVEELKAIVKYYMDKNCTTMEFSYKVAGETVVDAISEALSSNGYSGSYMQHFPANDKNVYIIKI